jgi:Raf kinase inhibitor-like YbhB/YbcL family protein
MTIQLTSSGFSEGATIPAKYTCDGEDASPPLRWASLPVGTHSLALIADDPDAQGGTWVHWVIYGIPASLSELPEGLPKTETAANGARQGTNDFRRIGYGGPCPPRGAPHRYFFKLYALGSDIQLEPGATKQALLDAMQGHILAERQLMGKCQRR